MHGPRNAFDDEDATRRAVPRTAPTAPSLVVLQDGAVTTHTLPVAGEVVIGRSEQCDVHIAHDSVSRRHAVVATGPTARIRDLGSANGVVVGATRIAPETWVALAPGAVLRIGTVTAVFEPGASRETPVEPAGEDLVVADPAVARLYELIGSIRDSAISVLLLGETGVGKEIVAEAIHRMSNRAARPLVRLHCAALAPTLLESELFGHEKGAFTGAHAAKPGLLESADGGTVFLDEVGELPAILQVKLLRVLEERAVTRVGALRPRAIDVRFVAATHRDLRAEIERGTFRQDLYFRLNGITLVVPSLRERRTEIEPLALRFVARASAGLRRTPPTLGPDARAALLAYDWPGNVRELRNAMERSVLLAREGVIGLAHLPPEIAAVAPAGPVPPDAPSVGPGEAMNADLAATERRHILQALEQCGGNQTRAAALLGVSRRTLISRLAAYDLPRPRKRGPA